MGNGRYRADPAPASASDTQVLTEPVEQASVIEPQALTLREEDTRPRSGRRAWKSRRYLNQHLHTEVPAPVVDISVIAPVFNEEGNLFPLHERLVASLSGLNQSYEILYVDDGSSDGSYAELEQIADHDPHTRVVRFRRNFGQTAAIAAGIDHACGRLVVMIDADNQNDPADIPRLLSVLEQGYDVVSGWRKDRHDPLGRKIPSRIANTLIARATGVHLHDYGCTLKVYRGELVKQLNLYGEMHRFIPAYLAQLGARVTEIPVTHHPRVVGRSKYGMGRTFRVILDLLTVKYFGTYATRPMHLFGVVGLACLALSVLALIMMVWQKVVLDVSMIQTPLLTLSAILVLMGFNALLLGLLGELVMRTYFESQNKRPYQLWTVLNLPRNRRRAANVRH